MLSSAETRSRIRTLSTSQVFFGLDELDDQQIRTLLPHLTETQWAGILDLDLWSRDQVQIGRFLYWQRYILTAVPAVARKLLRASDPELWQLAFKRRLEIYRRNPEDTYPDVTGDGEQMETPDGQYMISLPDNEEEARLIRALLLHLYELEPQNACLLLEASLAATSIQLEEAAYQQRIRRTESLGYQDYFRAIDLYTPLEPQELLPQKTWEIHSPAAFLPTQLVPTVERPSLLFEAATALSSQTEIHSFLEELLFVCNKIISADRIPVGEADPVRKAISKAICGINLGLDIWCQSDPERATEGLRRHYLQSFFSNWIWLLDETPERSQDTREDQVTRTGIASRKYPGTTLIPLSAASRTEKGEIPNGILHNKRSITGIFQTIIVRLQVVF